MTRYTEIQTKIKDIDVTITYADKKVTKLESTWVSKDDKTSKITIQFKGTSTQNIEYPVDLNTYPNR